jgi:hypothetical protein
VVSFCFGTGRIAIISHIRQGFVAPDEEKDWIS